MVAKGALPVPAPFVSDLSPRHYTTHSCAFLWHGDVVPSGHQRSGKALSHPTTSPFALNEEKGEMKKKGGDSWDSRPTEAPPQRTGGPPQKGCLGRNGGGEGGNPTFFPIIHYYYTPPPPPACLPSPLSRRRRGALLSTPPK